MPYRATRTVASETAVGTPDAELSADARSVDSTEPIAIVGMACPFKGALDSMTALRDFLFPYGGKASAPQRATADVIDLPGLGQEPAVSGLRAALASATCLALEVDEYVFRDVTGTRAGVFAEKSCEMDLKQRARPEFDVTVDDHLRDLMNDRMCYLILIETTGYAERKLNERTTVAALLSRILGTAGPSTYLAAGPSHHRHPERPFTHAAAATRHSGSEQSLGAAFSTVPVRADGTFAAPSELQPQAGVLPSMLTRVLGRPEDGPSHQWPQPWPTDCIRLIKELITAETTRRTYSGPTGFTYEEAMSLWTVTDGQHRLTSPPTSHRLTPRRRARVEARGASPLPLSQSLKASSARLTPWTARLLQELTARTERPILETLLAGYRPVVRNRPARPGRSAIARLAPLHRTTAHDALSTPARNQGAPARRGAANCEAAVPLSPTSAVTRERCDNHERSGMSPLAEMPYTSPRTDTLAGRPPEQPALLRMASHTPPRRNQAAATGTSTPPPRTHGRDRRTCAAADVTDGHRVT
ncbi:hypothetical protein [Streptomyces sp. BK205]|uniref:hypothetical protein n=1 Tax=Streptomyces sp. BK205 TaxID=2512164 RepID=UPI00104DC456|nr:hypothetical protein [Streptomyces sp. BK205]TCR15960.1 hypothetical protein EV578_11572 [Streptomyces sp. BK205]